MSSHYGKRPSIHDLLYNAYLLANRYLKPSLFALFNHIRNLDGRAILKEIRHELTFRQLFTLVNLLTVIWLVIVYRGERAVFKNSFEACEWSNWEKWPENATPHHLVFVADPQLVDPHTYPGRPWPLSTLTERYTDQYMRRSFSRIQTALHPDSVLFLGDLFDGGREWSTYNSTSPEKRWRKYGQSYWLGEHSRFSRIFFDHWDDGGTSPGIGQPARRLLAGLPGNHDLGFGPRIQIEVRKRFNAYFGDGSRVDVIANHTFVSVDTVSLSAWDAGPQDAANAEIWTPVMEFLDGAQEQKKLAVTRELRRQNNLPTHALYRHAVIDTPNLPGDHLPALDKVSSDLPTILLSHVPLYRAPGTPCGPLREKWPPTPPPKGQTEPLENDARNAISVSGGYQYQNVLTLDVSKILTEKIGNIYYAFSGDDHDYCELIHRGYTSSGGGIHEITVKSISWAMGVRKPGFQMLSLWNPVDSSGKPLSPGTPTIQTHLCLLPDQLGMFIRYALLLGFTLFCLSVRAVLVMVGIIKPAHVANPEAPLLPIHAPNISSAENEKAQPFPDYSNSINGHASKSSSTSDHSTLSSRPTNNRNRSISPKGGYGLPASQVHPLDSAVGNESSLLSDSYGVDTGKGRIRHQKLVGRRLFFKEFKRNLIRVASVVLTYYFWLIWRD